MEAPAPDEVRAIAERVTSIRGLTFKATPSARVVPADDLDGDARESFDDEYPKERQADDEAVFGLLGYLDPARSFEEGVDSWLTGIAGYYEPDDGAIALADTPFNEDGAGRDLVLAHELVHALEDQRFGLGDEGAPLDDAGLARAALWEGTATVVEERYDTLHFGDAVLDVDEETDPTIDDDIPMAFAAADNLLYVKGREFVDTLLAQADGDWRLVNRALRDRPPLSTEHILDPGTYREMDPPESVDIAPLAAVFGGQSGWKRRTGGTIGRLDAALLVGAGDDRRAARLDDHGVGWEGGSYQLWRRGEGGECAPPCTAGTALVIKLRWESAEEAAGYADDVRLAARGRFEGTLAGADRWASRGGAIALRHRGDTTAVVFAPTESLAGRLATVTVR